MISPDAWTNDGIIRRLGSRSGCLFGRFTWSSSSKLRSWGSLGADRSCSWCWLLQAKPQAQSQAQSLRVRPGLSLRGEWSLRTERKVVDRWKARGMGSLLRTSTQIRKCLLPGAERRRVQVQVVRTTGEGREMRSQRVSQATSPSTKSL